MHPPLQTITQVFRFVLLENLYLSYFSQLVQDVESMAQLRTDMTQIHDEISELRKLVESCMQWQSKLHESIKLEVSNVVSQAGFLIATFVIFYKKTFWFL
jgi:hypothetical protein